ncbi:MAG: ribosome small subunit-dependent GTPase A [Bacteroidales bacterium]|nr:ribosome small subunit-dependent GTPase A [Bacteroidales bacterium]
MEGTVIKSTGSWLSVLTEKGETFQCKLKGNFRIKGIKSTNPVAVGDVVGFELIDSENTGLIQTIFPRNNYIIRKSTKLSKVSHIIAANIDQVCIIATFIQPRTSTGFIDRILVTAEAYHIPGVIIFNKTDLHKDKQTEQLNKLEKIYSDAGYTVIATSVKKAENLDRVKAILKNKKTLITGHSGVGKSAMVNAIEPRLNLKTREISYTHNKGMHTTTFAEMFGLSFGGSIIDTPGIKEFGLTDFSRDEIAERFPEMRKYMHQCRFNNCTHVHEPGCAVITAIENGNVSLSRYENYLNILTDDYWEKTEKDFRL